MNCRKFPRFYCFTDFPQRVSLPSSSSSQWKGLRKCSTRTWFSPKQTASWSDHDSGKKRQKENLKKKKITHFITLAESTEKRQQHKSLTGSGNTDATFTDEK
jgi:hypothetical protein